MVSAPVGQFSAGVFVPVAERVVTVAVQRDAAAVSLAHFRQRAVRNLRAPVRARNPSRVLWERGLTGIFGRSAKAIRCRRSLS